MTELINSKDLHAARTASEVLKQGGVIVYPTETLYGIAARALDSEAADKVFQIKGRPKDMPIPILIKDVEMLGIVAELNEKASQLARLYWPGALTLIVKEKGVLPEVVTAGTGKVAVRMSKNIFVRALFEHIDEPITSTSANISGGGNLTQIDDIKKEFEGKVDLIIDSGNIPSSKGSTIVDVSVNPPEIVRAGDIKEEEIMEHL